MSRLSCQRLRDFHVAHYLLSGHQVQASAELAHKIATFRARGEVSLYEHETFTGGQLGRAVRRARIDPETFDPAADNTSPDVLKGELKRILRFIKDRSSSKRPMTRICGDCVHERGEASAPLLLGRSISVRLQLVGTERQPLT